jgi:hypothetical protein
MNEDRIHELAKDRVAQIKMADICNSAVIGIIALWLVWVATSVLIRFVR